MILESVSALVSFLVLILGIKPNVPILIVKSHYWRTLYTDTIKGSCSKIHFVLSFKGLSKQQLGFYIYDFISIQWLYSAKICFFIHRFNQNLPFRQRCTMVSTCILFVCFVCLSKKASILPLLWLLCCAFLKEPFNQQYRLFFTQITTDYAEGRIYLTVSLHFLSFKGLSHLSNFRVCGFHIVSTGNLYV